MQTFLSDLTDALINRFGTDFSGVTVVFPTRRAGVFFRAELSKKISGPIWAPKILAIQDLMLELANRTLPDPVTQLFELYDVYRTYFPNEEFDEYYPWGEVMLKDFDELDKSLANPANVFSIIADLKEIDASFALSDEELERLRSFWGNFFDKESTRLKDEFARTWRHLKSIYDDFHRRLDAKGWSTEGHAFRTVAAGIRKEDGLNDRIGNHVVFAGLYALSRSEEQVIEYLMEEELASIYWDADSYYVNDRHQEAGHFLRTSPLFKTSNSVWIGNHLSDSEKSIEVIGIPMEVGQAKMAGHLVDRLEQEEGFVPERTAVVLPAEHLLFPVLYALPEAIGKVNVTMGYPLHQTPIFYLFESLVRLQENIRIADAPGKTSYFFRDVHAVLDHPYIRMIDTKGIRNWKEKHVKDTSIRISEEKLVESDAPQVFAVLFRPVREATLMFEWCRDIIRAILASMDERDFAGHVLESEFIARLHAQLGRLEEIYTSVSAESSLSTWWRLFREIIQSTKIPFSGEPLEGLQLMGFLESRVLDFENVILLSVNEDILPASGQHPSFIPYGIRKAFGLPTHEDVHAVTAYHFYRLLQRAKRIYLLHNTENGSITSGEPSRFIVQLEEELVRKFPDKIRFSKKNMLTPVSGQTYPKIVVEKSDEVMNTMNRWFYQSGAEKKYHRKLSPSAISLYISCGLKFYLSYVAGLREEDERQETLEAALLGKVLHHAMEHLYEGQRTISIQQFNGLHERAVEAVDNAIQELFTDPADLEGKNLLLKEVIIELVRKILDMDKLSAPLTILQVEEEVIHEFAIDQGKDVLLKGVIDRIDQVAATDGTEMLRVVDYKTGRFDFKKVKDTADLFKDPELKEQFQTMLYAWIVSRKRPGFPIQTGLVTLRKMSEGILLTNDKAPFTTDQLNEFETGFRSLLKELFDPAVPFVQTDDEGECEYCSFKDICGR